MENNYQNQPIYESEPVYQPIVEEPKKNKIFGVISLITGLLSVLTCCLMGGNIVFSIAAIVMACLDRAKNGKMGAMSVIGLIGGIIGILLALVFIILYIAGVVGSAASSSYYY